MTAKPVFCSIFDRSFWRLSLLLAVAVVAAYVPVFQAGFVNFDDTRYVYENRMVSNGWTWEGTKWALSTAFMGSWHPLTWFSHFTDVEFYGLQPPGHHVTSLMLHLLNVLLSFALLRVLTGAVWPAAVAAAVFGLHPLHVESVAWVSERKDVLSTFFGLLTLLAYLGYVRAKPTEPSSSVTFTHWNAKPKVWYAAALGCLACGLMSKPMLVTWPLLLLLLDWWPLQRIQPTNSASRLRVLGWRLWEKIPFFLLVGGMAYLTWRTQDQSQAIQSLSELPLPTRFTNVLHSYFVYLRQFFWPVGLAMFYPMHSWSFGVLLMAVAALVGLSVFAWRAHRSHPEFAAGWLWYLIVLFPVCGLTQAGLQAHADRYTYLPSLGWSLTLIWPLTAVFNRRSKGSYFWRALLGGWLLVLGVRTYQQTRVWQNSEALFRHALAVTSGNFMAHQGLGEELTRIGRDAEAKQEFATALGLYPKLPSARNNLAVILLREGRYDEALNMLQAVLVEAPDLVITHFNLAQTYEKLRQPAQAAREYKLFLAAQPDDAEARAGFGQALNQVVAAPEALEQLRELHRHFPADSQIALLLAGRAQAEGRLATAVVAYESALALSPQSAELHNNLAWILAACPDAGVRDGARAVQLAGRACELTGFQQPLFLGTLAAAYAEAGQFDDAIAAAQKAIDLAAASDQADLVARNTELQKLYRARQPFHEPAK